MMSLASMEEKRKMKRDCLEGKADQIDAHLPCSRKKKERRKSRHSRPMMRYCPPDAGSGPPARAYAIDVEIG